MSDGQGDAAVLWEEYVRGTAAGTWTFLTVLAGLAPAQMGVFVWRLCILHYSVLLGSIVPMIAVDGRSYPVGLRFGGASAAGSGCRCLVLWFSGSLAPWLSGRLATWAS